MKAVFRDSCTGEIIELSSPVVELVTRYRQTGSRQVEQGGLLFANPEIVDRVVIDIASAPHPKDRAARASLVLDHDRCMAEIGAANRDGRWFVGYWHTHPERTPSISPADRKSFDENLRNGGHSLEALLAVLVGTSDRNDGLSAYLIKQGSVHALSIHPD